MNALSINSAEVVVPCQSLDETLKFFVDELGFRLETIFPADAPRVAVVKGYGSRIRLDAEAPGEPGTVRIHCSRTPDGPQVRTAPNGTTIEFVVDEGLLELPPLEPSLVVQRGDSRDGFGKGRAGMQYRDLIPDRFGGRFIASHIRIPTGGPVPDHVHYHHIQFQLIYCVHGWVRVVYEDQGPPMLMEAGDCFLQPPHIRHRVLESSDELEVVEISCPAEHETRIDHEMTLPTENLNQQRVFSGQRFVFHQESTGSWRATGVEGLEHQQTDIEDATNGIVLVNTLRANSPVAKYPLTHDADLRFLFVLQGAAFFDDDSGTQQKIQRGDSCAIPAALNCGLREISAEFKALEVCVPSQ